MLVGFHESKQPMRHSSVGGADAERFSWHLFCDDSHVIRMAKS
jgi:hypothetical protein